MAEQKVVIIVGMHRSGTSLTASLVQNAGLQIGERIVGPAQGNPRGHFEDRDFLDFHQSVMNRLGMSFLAQQPVDRSALLPEEVNNAKRLLQSRAAKDLWGWKDPRTCLFLSLWEQLLPDAKYIIVYRHPLEVILSLIRRSTPVDLEAFASPFSGLTSWEVHNRCILDLIRRRRTNSHVCHISRVFSDPEKFIESTAQKLNLPLTSVGARQLCHSDEIKLLQISPDADRLLGTLMPGLMNTYGALNEWADLPELHLPSRTSDDCHLSSSVRGFKDLSAISHGEASLALRQLVVLVDAAGMESAHRKCHKYIQNLEAALSVTSDNAFSGLDIYEQFSGIQQRLTRCEADLNIARTKVSACERALAEAEMNAFLFEVQARVSNRRLLIWGAGEGGKRVARFFRRHSVPWKAFIDSDQARQKRLILGHPVASASALAANPRAQRPYVVIGSIFQQPISRQLQKYGFRRKIDFIRAPRQLFSAPGRSGEKRVSPSVVNDEAR